MRDCIISACYESRCHAHVESAGGSAAAAGQLVEQVGGTMLEYVFIIELDFLKGRDKLNAPVYTLLSSQSQ